MEKGGRTTAAGLRAELAGEGSLGAWIRAARRMPYLAVIGAREARDGPAAVRLRDGRRPGPLPTGELIRRVGERVAARGRDPWE